MVVDNKGLTNNNLFLPKMKIKKYTHILAALTFKFRNARYSDAFFFFFGGSFFFYLDFMNVVVDWWVQWAKHCIDFGGGLVLGNPAFAEMIVICNVPFGLKQVVRKRINPWCLVK